LVDNPWFRAFVWFLDASVTIPTRKQWQNKHFGDAVDDAQKSIMDTLSGVKGVSLMFDLWMSRNGEDVLSLDIAFIDRSWNFVVKKVGIIHCKEGTAGEQVV